MKLLKIEEVIEKTTLGKSSIFDYVKKGKFPRPVKVGERAVAWKDDEIDEWISNLPRNGE